MTITYEFKANALTYLAFGNKKGKVSLYYYGSGTNAMFTFTQYAIQPKYIVALLYNNGSIVSYAIGEVVSLLCNSSIQVSFIDTSTTSYIANEIIIYTANGNPDSLSSLTLLSTVSYFNNVNLSKSSSEVVKINWSLNITTQGTDFSSIIAYIILQLVIPTENVNSTLSSQCNSLITNNQYSTVSYAGIPSLSVEYILGGESSTHSESVTPTSVQVYANALVINFSITTPNEQGNPYTLQGIVVNSNFIITTYVGDTLESTQSSQLLPLASLSLSQPLPLNVTIPAKVIIQIGE